MGGARQVPDLASRLPRGPRRSGVLNCKSASNIPQSSPIALGLLQEEKVTAPPPPGLPRHSHTSAAVSQRSADRVLMSTNQFRRCSTLRAAALCPRPPPLSTPHRASHGPAPSDARASERVAQSPKRHAVHHPFTVRRAAGIADIGTCIVWNATRFQRT